MAATGLNFAYESRMKTQLQRLFILGFILMTGCKANSNPGPGADSSNAAKPVTEKPVGSMVVAAVDFVSGAAIPQKYSCEGENISPQLTWDILPTGAKSLALVCEDPDAPRGKFIHWVIYNIPPTEKGLGMNVTNATSFPNGTMQGLNGAGKVGYTGPCPPPGKPHRYFFHLFALNTVLDYAANMDHDKLLTAMQGHIIAEAETMGTYERK